MHNQLSWRRWLILGALGPAACSPPEAEQVQRVEQPAAALPPPKPRKRFASAAAVLHDSTLTYWEGTPPDTSKSSLIRLVFSFHPDTGVYSFHGQCQAMYPARLQDGAIILNWSEEVDCVFDRGLDRRFAGVRRPEPGRPFVRYVLRNDTTLRATYYYPGWTTRFNQTSGEQDTLFPSTLHVNQDFPDGL
ncbi:hypothetical protein EJV47_15220 [Hymenobacter gummosus]|uniref:Uncharacterized protein n=1 Tax=Hymenobacter gummosus TaxID=1776032 RepID=A0A431U1I0_9BACT|nr:hypothetical protein [Hymenobacter gummosus]RTQ48942.1 hypothetical protein EJV47_15220 [Hymenobacter gummosus]